MKIRNYNSSPYSRYNEVVNKQPFVVSHDLLKKIKPKTDDDKVDDYNNYSLSISKTNNLLLQRQLVMFLNELELELRRQKRLTEVDVVFELGEELALFPSKYQRPNMFVSELRASPVWRAEDTGQADQLASLVNNWVKISSELVNLTSELEDWEWKAGSNFEDYDVYWFLGDGQISLPNTGCDVAPTFCDLVSKFRQEDASLPSLLSTQYRLFQLSD